MKALLDLFKQVTQEEEFDAITDSPRLAGENPLLVLW
jgi:hypothetical protein